jgi:hypothetical protein
VIRLAANTEWEDNRHMATLPNSEKLWTLREYLGTSWSPDRAGTPIRVDLSEMFAELDRG